MVFEHASMDDSESNTRTEIDFVEVAERKDRPDDPMHASGKFRDGHNGTNVLTDVQRLWLHHPASSSLPRHGRIPIPKIGTPLVYSASRLMSCRDMTTVMSGNDLTNQTPPNCSRGGASSAVTAAAAGR